MSSQVAILNKNQTLITNHFHTPEEAFSFFETHGSAGKRKRAYKTGKTG